MRVTNRKYHLFTKPKAVARTFQAGIRLTGQKENSYLRTNTLDMLVERTNKEVIIRLPASVNTEDLQDFLNYARYKELTANFKVDQKEVDKLADKINAKWWTENRDKLIK